MKFDLETKVAVPNDRPVMLSQLVLMLFSVKMAERPLLAKEDEDREDARELVLARVDEAREFINAALPSARNEWALEVAVQEADGQTPDSAT